MTALCSTLTERMYSRSKRPSFVSSSALTHFRYGIEWLFDNRNCGHRIFAIRLPFRS